MINTLPLQISFYEKFRGYVNPYKDLENRIHRLALKKISEITDRDLKDIQKTVKILNHHYFFTGNLENDFKIFLNANFEKILLSLSEKDEVFEFMKYSSKHLDLNVLLNEVGFESLEDALSAGILKSSFKDEMTTTSFAKERNEIWNECKLILKQFIHKNCDVIVSLFGFGKTKSIYEPEGVDFYYLYYKLQSYKEIITSPMILYSFLLVYFNHLPAIIITAVIIKSLVAFAFVYNKFYKPCPKVIEPFEYLNEKTYHSKDVIFERREIFSEIENAFRSQKAVLLVGDPGAGKTCAIHAFAKALIENKTCRFIKNPNVFKSEGGSISQYGNCFKTIEEKLIDHKNNSVFLIDEFATIFIPQANSTLTPMVDQLKIFLDQFKLVLGATTKDEYDQYIKPHLTMTDRRIVVIDLKKLESDPLEKILLAYIKHQDLAIEIEDGVISHIAENAKKFNSGTTEIDAAFSLLNRAISEIMDPVVESKLENELRDLALKEHQIKQKVEMDSKDYPELLKQFKEIKINEAKVQASIKKRDQNLAVIKNLEYLYGKQRKESYLYTDETMTENSPKFTKWLKSLLKVKMTKLLIQKQKRNLALPFCLNKELIDKILLKR